MIEATLIFDGGGNKRVACYGSYHISLSTGETWGKSRISLPGATTSNEAEYLTLIAALNSLMGQLGSLCIRPPHVVLTAKGDSQLVVRQINREYRCTCDRMFDLCIRACQLLNNFHADTRVEWHPRKHSVAAFGH